ncbi:hypothetical protein BCR33DRAFT_714219 [Rhizoclosmatium globosum]|uniref:Secreted protein n=1 Tax=Rhizoclosmatium globosum TaxID=329046 RepID=A0A1Y2CQ81_9FUNG|nr:hypothetical protein BCR33DRAFT_714219 [Rhizoclosmatium globosum]|eukprot:ORY49191.1 hypothetical protein BCR33DRAFT_714219 [Rhizoclosmatium globosum]
MNALIVLLSTAIAVKSQIVLQGQPCYELGSTSCWADVTYQCSYYAENGGSYLSWGKWFDGACPAPSTCSGNHLVTNNGKTKTLCETGYCQLDISGRHAACRNIEQSPCNPTDGISCGEFNGGNRACFISKPWDADSVHGVWFQCNSLKTTEGAATSKCVGSNLVINDLWQYCPFTYPCRTDATGLHAACVNLEENVCAGPGAKCGEGKECKRVARPFDRDAPHGEWYTCQKI